MKINGNIPKDALKILKRLEDNGYEAYIVGGCVRDMLLGVEPKDFDICTNAKPSEVLELFKDYNTYTVGIEFGTVMVSEELDIYEITTYRTDGEYKDGRRPDKVEFNCDIKDDLGRRDFTINAMAYNPFKDELVDPFNGADDLKNKRIVAVGDADRRFQEDAIRILRALRFSIVYGFDIEESTVQGMKNNLDNLDNISKERITSELRKILESGAKVREHFQEYRWLIAKIIPELECTFDFKQNNKYHKHDVYNHILNTVDNCESNLFELKLAALLHDIGKPKAYTVDKNGEGHFYGHPELSYEITKEILDKRLRLNRVSSNLVLSLVKNHDIMIASTKPSVRRAYNKLGFLAFCNLLTLKRADMSDHIYKKGSPSIVDVDRVEEIFNEIMDEDTTFDLKSLEVNGNDIMEHLGIKEGKEVGTILKKLLDLVISEVIPNSKEELLAKARELTGEQD